MTGLAKAPKLCAMAYENFLIDKRVVERNIAKGLVDANELKRHIDGLPDRESNCVHVSLDGSTSDSEGAIEDAAEDDEDADEPAGSAPYEG